MPSEGAPLPSAVPTPERFARGSRPRGWIIAAIALGALGVAAIVLWWFLPHVGPGDRWLPFGGVILVLLVVWGSMWAIRIAFWSSRGGRQANGGYPGGRPDPAVRIARVRYARGEISREQYEQIVDGLRRPGPPD